MQDREEISHGIVVGLEGQVTAARIGRCPAWCHGRSPGVATGPHCPPGAPSTSTLPGSVDVPDRRSSMCT